MTVYEYYNTLVDKFVELWKTEKGILVLKHSFEDYLLKKLSFSTFAILKA